MTDTVSTAPSYSTAFKSSHILSRRECHGTFGGIICNSDFNTENPSGFIINRIISDLKFNERCKNNSENRDRRKKV